MNETMTVTEATNLILDAQGKVSAAIAALEARRGGLAAEMATLDDEIAGLRGVLNVATTAPVNGNGHGSPTPLRCRKGCDRTFAREMHRARHEHASH